MSTQQNIPQRVRAILAEQALRPVEEVHDEDLLTGLGLDGLDTVEIGIEAEDQFGFRMTEADVVNFVQKKVTP